MRHPVKRSGKMMVLIPDSYKEKFSAFCDLNHLKYGRVVWTLVRMLMKRQVDTQAFLAEYRDSTAEVYKNHSTILEAFRINGRQAHSIHKLTTTSNSDIIKE